MRLDDRACQKSPLHRLIRPGVTQARAPVCLVDGRCYRAADWRLIEEYRRSEPMPIIKPGPGDAVVALWCGGAIGR
jgi:hypothetical protein